MNQKHDAINLLIRLVILEDLRKIWATVVEQGYPKGVVIKTYLLFK